MGLSSLPVEIITYILLAGPVESIRRCLQVSRLFRSIVFRSSLLQYLLELDSCGYTEPANPRQDLDYVDKVQFLQATRTRWLQVNLVKPNLIQTPVTGIGNPTYEYVDGIYVRGSRALDSSSMLTRCLNFYQLPSLNKGTPYKHWCHEDLGVDTRDFAICPKQDLLVLLETASVNILPPHAEFEEYYKIHLRTMSTNKVHPAAMSAPAGLLDCRIRSGLYPDRSYCFQILGRLLAIVFCSRERDMLSYVVIWDWTTRLTIAQIEFPGGPHSSFSFISEEYFVVPRNSESYDISTPVENDTMGRLDLCALRPNSGKILSYSDCHLASFMLPKLERGESCLHLRCAPTPTPNSYYVQQDPYPRIYDVPPEAQLLCINIRTSPTIYSPFNEPHGTLYVPSRSLLNAIVNPNIYRASSGGIVSVHWDEWAKDTSWVDTREFRMSNERYMSGQRIVGLGTHLSLMEHGHIAVTIFDFDERRLKMRRAYEHPSASEVFSPQPTEGDSELAMLGDLPLVYDRSCGHRFFEGNKVPQRHYTKTVIGLPSNHTDIVDSIMMDDEHVVVKASGEQGTTVLVYNF